MYPLYSMEVNILPYPRKQDEFAILIYLLQENIRELPSPNPFWLEEVTGNINE